MTLSLSQARAIIAGTLAAGSAAQFKPLTVVVLDAGGHVLAVEREDGSSNKRFEIAHGKAHGAVSMGMGSRALMERAEQQPYFVAARHPARSARWCRCRAACWCRPRTGPCSVRSASPATPPTTTRRPRWPASSRPGWWVRRTDVPIVDVELVGETLADRGHHPTPGRRRRRGAGVPTRRDLGASPAARAQPVRRERRPARRRAASLRDRPGAAPPDGRRPRPIGSPE